MIVTAVKSHLFNNNFIFKVFFEIVTSRSDGYETDLYAYQDWIFTKSYRPRKSHESLHLNEKCL
jgi:hypothetical protein